MISHTPPRDLVRTISAGDGDDTVIGGQSIDGDLAMMS